MHPIFGMLEYINLKIEPLPTKEKKKNQISPAHIEEWLIEEKGISIKPETVSMYLEQLSELTNNRLIEKKVTTKGRREFYYHGIISSAQVKILSDIICSSIFLNEEDAKDLIVRIKSLTKSEKSDSTQINQYIRYKPLNNECLNNIQLISKAINKNCRITYYYGQI